MKKLQYYGFTLIELLIVISVITLLSSIILSSLNSARQKARDTMRVQETDQIFKGIEIYFQNKGYYPNCSGHIFIDDGQSDCLSSALINEGIFNELPTDPKNGHDGSNSYGDYQYRTNDYTRYYYIRSILESDKYFTQNSNYPGIGSRSDFVDAGCIDESLPDAQTWQGKWFYLGPKYSPDPSQGCVQWMHIANRTDK